MGGSGGGGFTFHQSSPSELRDQIRKAELEEAEVKFAPELAQRLNKLLSSINQRDTELTSERLADVKAMLQDKLEKSFDLRFGGSVAKHTFVDGLSDVDTLLVLRERGEETPSDVLNDVAEELMTHMPNVEVSRGKIAVTLKYDDGEEIQLIPAVKQGAKMQVPAWEMDGWSSIDPDGFRKALTKTNERCAGKLVPAIKLAKAINATLPEQQRLSGYHIEAMAIDTFKNYKGQKVVEKMLPALFKSMAKLVKGPIRDSTGQSVHVDEYLGRKGSAPRLQASHVLDRIARRMENATAANSLEQWNTILGEH